MPAEVCGGIRSECDMSDRNMAIVRDWAEVLIQGGPMADRGVLMMNLKWIRASGARSRHPEQMSLIND